MVNLFCTDIRKLVSREGQNCFPSRHTCIKMLSQNGFFIIFTTTQAAVLSQIAAHYLNVGLAIHGMGIGAGQCPVPSVVLTSTFSGTQSTFSGTQSTFSGTQSTFSGTQSTFWYSKYLQWKSLYLQWYLSSTFSGTESTFSSTQSTFSSTQSTFSGTQCTFSGTFK
jgi:hypothetical protein